MWGRKGKLKPKSAQGIQPLVGVSIKKFNNDFENTKIEFVLFIWERESVNKYTDTGEQMEEKKKSGQPTTLNKTLTLLMI